MKKSFILLALLGCLMATAQEFEAKGEYIFATSSIYSYVGYDSLGEGEDVFQWSNQGEYIYYNFDTNEYFTSLSYKPSLEKFKEQVEYAKANGKLRKLYRVSEERVNRFADESLPIIRLIAKNYRVKAIGKYSRYRVDLNLNEYYKL